MTDLDLSKYEGHTPGEWRADKGAGCRRIMAGKDGAHAQARWRVEVASTSGLSDDNEDRANARLIADAPLLLAEVKRLREENKTFRAAQKACEDCDAPTAAQVAALRQSHARLLAAAKQAENWTLPRCICRPGEKCLGCELRAAVAEAEALNG